MEVSKVKVYNVMEAIVEEELDHIMAQEGYEGCKCPKCKADILAVALNELQPKYVVSEKGELITKVMATMPQNRADVLAAIARACQIVGRSPKHEG